MANYRIVFLFFIALTHLPNSSYGFFWPFTSWSSKSSGSSSSSSGGYSDLLFRPYLETDLTALPSSINSDVISDFMSTSQPQSFHSQHIQSNNGFYGQNELHQQQPSIAETQSSMMEQQQQQQQQQQGITSEQTNLEQQHGQKQPPAPVPQPLHQQGQMSSQQQEQHYYLTPESLFDSKRPLTFKLKQQSQQLNGGQIPIGKYFLHTAPSSTPSNEQNQFLIIQKPVPQQQQQQAEMMESGNQQPQQSSSSAMVNPFPSNNWVYVSPVNKLNSPQQPIILEATWLDSSSSGQNGAGLQQQQQQQVRQQYPKSGVKTKQQQKGNKNPLLSWLPAVVSPSQLHIPLWLKPKHQQQQQQQQQYSVQPVEMIAVNPAKYQSQQQTPSSPVTTIRHQQQQQQYYPSQATTTSSQSFQPSAPQQPQTVQPQSQQPQFVKPVYIYTTAPMGQASSLPVDYGTGSDMSTSTVGSAVYGPASYYIHTPIIREVIRAVPSQQLVSSQQTSNVGPTPQQVIPWTTTTTAVDSNRNIVQPSSYWADVTQGNNRVQFPVGNRPSQQQPQQLTPAEYQVIRNQVLGGGNSASSGSVSQVEPNQDLGGWDSMPLPDVMKPSGSSTSTAIVAGPSAPSSTGNDEHEQSEPMVQSSSESMNETVSIQSVQQQPSQQTSSMQPSHRVVYQALSSATNSTGSATSSSSSSSSGRSLMYNQYSNPLYQLIHSGPIHQSNNNNNGVDNTWSTFGSSNFTNNN